MHYNIIATCAIGKINTIPKFADLYWKIKINDRKMFGKIPKKTNFSKRPSTSTLRPAISLIPELTELDKNDKAAFIGFDLPTIAGENKGVTYKKQTKKFDEGTPEEYIILRRDLDEIWAQNEMTTGRNRAATVRSLLQNESLTTFETSLEEQHTSIDDDGETLITDLTDENVNEALLALSETIFPHRALEVQKLWMQRGMRKPLELSTRKTASAISRLNNALPLFPNGSVEDKFDDADVISLLEWSLPPAWRKKFELDGYNPSDGSKQKLILACEAIERHAKADSSKEKKEKGDTSKKRKVTFDNKTKEGKKDLACTLHGMGNHLTKDCWTLKKQAREKGKNSSSNTTKSFSTHSFKKEIHSLTKTSKKRKVLEQYGSSTPRIG